MTEAEWTSSDGREGTRDSLTNCPGPSQLKVLDGCWPLFGGLPNVRAWVPAATLAGVVLLPQLRASDVPGFADPRR